MAVPVRELLLEPRRHFRAESIAGLRDNPLEVARDRIRDVEEEGAVPQVVGFRGFACSS